jgi:hypothetical protein
LDEPIWSKENPPASACCGDNKKLQKTNAQLRKTKLIKPEYDSFVSLLPMN